MATRVIFMRGGRGFYLTWVRSGRRKKATGAQANNQQHFKDSVRFAKRELADPKKLAMYSRRKGHRNAFQAAMAEYRKRENKSKS